MAFVKYEAESTRSATSKDVKVGKLGITVTKMALAEFGLDSATTVNLYWDADTDEIGIAAADSGDKSAFPIKVRGKFENKFIAAGKFYDRFGIVVSGRDSTDGVLENRDGIAAFKVPQPRAAAPKPPYTGKPRGRKKKVVEPEEQASE